MIHSLVLACLQVPLVKLSQISKKATQDSWDTFFIDANTKVAIFCDITEPSIVKSSHIDSLKYPIWALWLAQWLRTQVLVVVTNQLWHHTASLKSKEWWHFYIGQSFLFLRNRKFGYQTTLCTINSQMKKCQPLICVYICNGFKLGSIENSTIILTICDEAQVKGPIA